MNKTATNDCFSRLTKKPFAKTGFTGKPLYSKCIAVTAFLIFTLLASQVWAQTFVHPGLLHKQPDLDRMKEKVAAGQEPWKSSYDILVANSHSSLTRTHANPVP